MDSRFSVFMKRTYWHGNPEGVALLLWLAMRSSSPLRLPQEEFFRSLVLNRPMVPNWLVLGYAERHKKGAKGLFCGQTDVVRLAQRLPIYIYIYKEPGWEVFRNNTYVEDLPNLRNLLRGDWRTVWSKNKHRKSNRRRKFGKLTTEKCKKLKSPKRQGRTQLTHGCDKVWCKT